MKKKAMMGWVTGIPILVLVLILIIVIHEKEKDGITRAMAAKSVALVFLSQEELESWQADHGASRFPARSVDQWYVPYMDYLYGHGGLDEEMLPASAELAQKELTYQEAHRLAGFLGKSYGEQVKLNRANRNKAFPAEYWWQIYDQAAGEAKEGGVEIQDVILYGTPSNIETAPGWTCYTSGGDFRFEGLALDSYLDRKVRLYVRDGEVAGAGRLLSEDAVYENVWVDRMEEGCLHIHAGSITRKFPSPAGEEESQAFVHNIVDLHLEKGEVKQIVVKKDRITGTVLSVDEGGIEIEGYGRVETAPGFRVYKVYGEYEERERGDILVGYDLQEFVASGGKLCAALITRPFSAERIRVLLMDNDFQSIFHEQVTLTLTEGGTIRYGEKEREEKVEADTSLSILPGDQRLEGGRMVVTPEGREGGIRIDSLLRGHGVPVYGGILEIRQEGDHLVLVNDLLLEDYLKKVVPSEMPPSYGIEALKVQAVCART